MGQKEKRRELEERVERLGASVQETRARLEHNRIEADDAERRSQGKSDSLSLSQRIAVGTVASSWGLALIGYLVIAVGHCGSCADAKRDHTYRAFVVADSDGGKELGNHCEVVLGYARDEKCDARLRCGARVLFESTLECTEVEDSLNEISWIAIEEGKGPLIVDPNHGWARWTTEARSVELLLVDHDKEAW